MPDIIPPPNGIYRVYPPKLETIADLGLIDDRTDSFPDPLSFLRAWNAGYHTGRSQIHDYSLGFELYLSSQEFPPEGILLASDANDISEDHLCLGVNDFAHQRVLVYKPKKSLCTNPDRWRKNTFMENEPQHVGIDKFPLASQNPLKADERQWVMFGYNAQDFYTSLKEIGYRFPQ
jgi:hypothetical protein